MKVAVYTFLLVSVVIFAAVGASAQTAKPQSTPNSQKGVGDEKINSVIMHLEYQFGVGGAIYPTYNAYVLFNDGTIYQKPSVSLSELDVAASKRDESTKWGKWKLVNGTISIVWEARTGKNRTGEWKKDTYKKVAAANKNEILTGTFRTISGSGNTALGGDVMITSTSTLTFNHNGQFTYAKVSGASDSAMQTYYKGTQGGTYSLNGYSIELRFNNGTIEKRFFYFYPDNRKYFGIGSSTYRPVEN